MLLVMGRCVVHWLCVGDVSLCGCAVSDRVCLLVACCSGRGLCGAWDCVLVMGHCVVHWLCVGDESLYGAWAVCGLCGTLAVCWWVVVWVCCVGQGLSVGGLL